MMKQILQAIVNSLYRNHAANSVISHHIGLQLNHNYEWPNNINFDFKLPGTWFNDYLITAPYWYI
ncbi:hypothetical protein B9K06_27065, partial [Bacillus sp. OG2]